MKILILFVISLAIFSCGKGKTTTNNRTVSEDGNSDENGANPSEGEEGDPETIRFVLNDIGYFMADDLNGAVDSRFSDLNSEDLVLAQAYDLKDNGLTKSLAATFLSFLDQDKDDKVNLTDFVKGSIEAGDNKEALETATQQAKSLLFATVDENKNDYLEEAEIVELVRIRVWILDQWSGNNSNITLERLKKMIQGGFHKFQTYILEQYGSDDINDSELQEIKGKFISN